MKKFILLLLVLLAFSSFVFAQKNPSLGCGDEGGGGGTNLELLRMTSRGNAHAAIAGSSSRLFPYEISCRLHDNGGSKYGFTASCTGNATTILTLSTPTNAHVALPNPTPYENKICLTSDLGINCGTVTRDPSIEDGQITCEKNNYDTCVVSISGSSNAHVAPCDESNRGKPTYSTVICCSLEPPIISNDILKINNIETFNATGTLENQFNEEDEVIFKVSVSNVSQETRSTSLTVAVTESGDATLLTITPTSPQALSSFTAGETRVLEFKIENIPQGAYTITASVPKLESEYAGNNSASTQFAALPPQGVTSVPDLPLPFVFLSFIVVVFLLLRN